MYGEFIPLGGGDNIPLNKRSLLVGRRESCDIVLRFPNVSAHHCQLTVSSGYWYVKDLNSRNGVKVNNIRVTRKGLDPGDKIAIAKHLYEVAYSPADLGAIGPAPDEETVSAIFGRSLLEAAGLSKGKVNTVLEEDDDVVHRRDILADKSVIQKRKDSNKPV